MGDRTGLDRRRLGQAQYLDGEVRVRAQRGAGLGRGPDVEGALLQLPGGIEAVGVLGTTGT